MPRVLDAPKIETKSLCRTSPKIWENTTVTMITNAAERILVWRLLRRLKLFRKRFWTMVAVYSIACYNLPMPVTKSARKKLRKDGKREDRNDKVYSLLKRLIKKAKKHPSEKAVRETVALVDKTARHHLIHKNKAARIKSSLAKLLSKRKIKTPKPKKSKKT